MADQVQALAAKLTASETSGIRESGAELLVWLRALLNSLRRRTMDYRLLHRVHGYPLAGR